MDNTQREQRIQNRQDRLLRRAQRRLNRLMDLLAAVGAAPQTSEQEPEMEDMFQNNLTGFFTKGMALASPGVPSTTPNALVSEQSTISGTALESHEELCNDIRGRDRVCCNTGVKCFDDLTSTLDDLSTAPNDFSLLSACRVVGSELKKDKRCVSNALSRCTGPGRSLMHSRLDNRLDALYDQFYKHCRKNPFSQPPPFTRPNIIHLSTTTPVGTSEVPQTTKIPPVPITTNSGRVGNAGSIQPTNQYPAVNGGSQPTGEYAAIIAGALTGGVILFVILIVAAVLWCRGRRDDTGSDSSAGIIFFKPRHTPRPMPENNNKPPLLRQESDHYAEIDDRLVNPNLRPSLPPELTNLGYLNPVGEGQSVNYFQPESYNGDGPIATTRGQLSYGAILANSTQPSGAMFYHSSPVIDNRSMSNGSIHSSETLLSPRRFMSQHRPESNPNSYITTDSYDDIDQDEYEQPISASSSLRYSDLNKENTPDQVAPSPPREINADVANLPQRPTTSSTNKLSGILDINQPVPSPRRVRKDNSSGQGRSNSSDPNKPTVLEVNKIQLGPRDSAVSETSTKSSHHYFVLEPGSDKIESEKSEYENGISSPKLV